MNKNVFREYDIRGIVENDFKDDFVICLGKAFGTYLQNNNHSNISVSGDIRFTTNKLKKLLTKGLIEVGINVYDLGILPTPVNYFSLFNTSVVNSVQITGSHNPKEYNGFKLSFNKKPFYGNQIKELYSIILNNSYYNTKLKGKISEIKIIDDYINFIKKDIKIKKNIKCIMDCGNSVGSIVAPKLFNDLGIENEELFCDVNPDFPNLRYSIFTFN